MADPDQVKQKVQKYLIDSFKEISLDSDGDFSLTHGSAKVWINVMQLDPDSNATDQPTIVQVEALVLIGVTDGPELWKYIAYRADDFIFGHLSLMQLDDGTTVVSLTHRLLGDYLDEEELAQAVISVASEANDLDDTLQRMFGGKRFNES